MTSLPQNNITEQTSHLWQRRFKGVFATAAIEKEITLFSAPFSMDPHDTPDHLQVELVELQCVVVVDFFHWMKAGYKKFHLLRKCWACSTYSYTGSTYLCEKTFSLMNINKSRVNVSKWLSPVWHLAHQNNCSWAKPGLHTAVEPTHTLYHAITLQISKGWYWGHLSPIK